MSPTSAIGFHGNQGMFYCPLKRLRRDSTSSRPLLSTAQLSISTRTTRIMSTPELPLKVIGLHWRADKEQELVAGRPPAELKHLWVNRSSCEAWTFSLPTGHWKLLGWPRQAAGETMSSWLHQNSLFILTKGDWLSHTHTRQRCKCINSQAKELEGSKMFFRWLHTKKKKNINQSYSATSRLRRVKSGWNEWNVQNITKY